MLWPVLVITPKHCVARTNSSQKCSDVWGTNSDSTQVFTYRYGYMFGKESARKELAEKVNELKATIQKLENQDKV